MSHLLYCVFIYFSFVLNITFLNLILIIIKHVDELIQYFNLIIDFKFKS